MRNRQRQCTQARTQTSSWGGSSYGEVNLGGGGGGGGVMMFFMLVVHTTLYIGLSGVGYVERHSLHKVTTPLVVQLSVWLCSDWL